MRKNSGPSIRTYTRAEADARQLVYRTDWRAPEVEAGDWVLTDDGHVVQVTYSVTRRWIRTPMGMFEQNVRGAMTMDRVPPGKGHPKQRRTAQEEIKSEEWYVKRVAIARMFAGPAQFDWKRAATMVLGRPVRWAVLHALANDAEVWTVIADEVDRVIKEQGMGADWVLCQIRDVVQQAIAGKDFKNALVAIDRMIRLNRMEQPVTTALPGAQSQSRLRGFQFGESPQLPEAAQFTEVPDNGHPA